MLDFAIHFPFNSTSLGQCSFSIVKEIFKKELSPCIFNIQEPPDVSSQLMSQPFINWLQYNSARALSEHNKINPILKLWHIKDSFLSFSVKQLLYTFYELDEPTKIELNILKNQSVTFFPSEHFVDLFKSFGINCKAIPLGFDSEHFKEKTIKYPDDRICFGLVGKLEHRKHHLKIINTWIKKYGKNPKYFLNCAVYNNFIPADVQSNMIMQAMNGVKCWNVNLLPWMPTNEQYNTFLNANHIIIAMSGGESWGLPEFHSVGLGKHCVGLYAHGYKDWMTEENSVLVYPNGKIPVYDNIFFKKGDQYNQGNIFDWDSDEFLNACDVAIKRVENNPINDKGRELKSKFSWEKTANSLLEYMIL